MANQEKTLPMEHPQPETPRRLTYDVYLCTNRGRVRSGNEDNYVVNNIVRRLEEHERNLRGRGIPEPMVCAVFDGMGGEAYGELASEISAKKAAGIYTAMTDGAPFSPRMVNDFVSQSNAAINEMLRNSKMRRGGSTFVMTVLVNGGVYAYSLGDSRLYLYRSSALRQLSNDQTLAMKKYMANIFTWDEAQASNDKHKLTSFLGVDVDDEGLVPQAYPPFRPEIGDKLLLCSDGLYDMCSDEEICRLMARDSGDACLDLVEAALNNGGEDNVTCMIIELSPGQNE